MKGNQVNGNFEYEKDALCQNVRRARVCSKSDYENNNIGDGVFLVLREEWEDADDDSIKTFDLLLTSVENGTVKLFLAPNNAVVIIQALPYSRKIDYMEVPR